MECYQGATHRREFLRLAFGGATAIAAGSAVLGPGAAAAAEPAAPPIPTIGLGKFKVTRLLSGGNPIGGYSHSTSDMSACMLEWFNPERTVEYIHRIEREGINTWQFDYFDYIVKALRKAREGGSKIQFVCIHHDKRAGSLKDVVRDVDPIAIMHHGGVTDTFFREGKSAQVRDFVKRAHDLGVMAGVSTHNPDNVRRMVDENWECDLYMTCLHNLTRPADEQKKKFGTVAVDEPFFETDPVEMTAAIREVSKPCLAFKILAAGRRCWNPAGIEAAFKFAYGNIKKSDAVIVGMFPRYKDQVKENADFARKYAGL